MVSIVEDSVANKMMPENRDLLESPVSDSVPSFKSAFDTKEVVELVWFQADRGMLTAR